MAFFLQNWNVNIFLFFPVNTQYTIFWQYYESIYANFFADLTISNETQ